MQTYSEQSETRDDSPGLTPISTDTKITKPKRKVTEKQRQAGLNNLKKAQEKKQEMRKNLADPFLSDLEKILNSATVASHNEPEPEPTPTTKRKTSMIEPTMPHPSFDMTDMLTKINAINDNMNKTYEKVFKLYEYKKNKPPKQNSQIILQKQHDPTEELRNKILNIKK
jgi:hypothetical protein